MRGMKGMKGMKGLRDVGMKEGDEGDEVNEGMMPTWMQWSNAMVASCKFVAFV